jgi:hypothetical protein
MVSTPQSKAPVADAGKKAARKAQACKNASPAKVDEAVKVREQMASKDYADKKKNSSRPQDARTDMALGGKEEDHESRQAFRRRQPTLYCPSRNRGTAGRVYQGEPRAARSDRRRADRTSRIHLRGACCRESHLELLTPSRRACPSSIVQSRSRRTENEAFRVSSRVSASARSRESQPPHGCTPIVASSAVQHRLPSRASPRRASRFLP